MCWQKDDLKDKAAKFSKISRNQLLFVYFKPPKKFNTEELWENYPSRLYLSFGIVLVWTSNRNSIERQNVWKSGRIEKIVIFGLL